MLLPSRKKKRPISVIVIDTIVGMLLHPECIVLSNAKNVGDSMGRVFLGVQAVQKKPTPCRAS